MIMYGAVLGDMVGAPYEFDRGDKSKNFIMFNRNVHYTDDSVMTFAIADAILTVGIDSGEQSMKKSFVEKMQKWGNKYPDAGYGNRFIGWLRSYDPQPYNSWGNGSAMRVSSIGWLFDSIERTREVARWSAEVTHNHPEGIKGAEATAAAIYLARNGADKEEIKDYVVSNFDYDLSRTCNEIRPGYHHVESCMETVPEAITAFLEGKDFEDAIRTAVSLGGDCDTLTCITGGIAEAFYGIPKEMVWEVVKRLEDDMLSVLQRFNEQLGRDCEEPDREALPDQISFVIGDITTIQADAIVNAANNTLLGGGGVDGAIHRAAGPGLLEECITLNGCKTGQAKITKGYNLPARFVIHTVGPIYSGSDKDEKDLFDCYYNSLEVARENNLHSIAFPAISTGVYGYPKEDAAQISLKSIRTWFAKHEDYDMQVLIVSYSETDHEVYRKAAKFFLYS